MIPRVTNEGEIRHVTRGIREDAYRTLVVKHPATVSGIVYIRRNLQNPRSSRIWPPSPSSFLEIQTSAEPLPSALSSDDIWNMIRDVAREESYRRQLKTLVSIQPSYNTAVQNVFPNAYRSHYLHSRLVGTYERTMAGRRRNAINNETLLHVLVLRRKKGG